MASRNRKRKNNSSHSNNNATAKSPDDNVININDENNQNSESVESIENIEQLPEVSESIKIVDEVNEPEVVQENNVAEPVETAGTILEEKRGESKLEESIENIESNEDKVEETEIKEEINIADKEKPAVDSNVKSKDSNIFKTAAVLGIITLAVAFVLSVVNGVTAPVIQERALVEKAAAVESLFGDISDIAVEKFDGELVSPVVEILYVRKISDNSLIGYCVNVQPKGFGGKINMLVALNMAKKITGVNILEISETAGIGSKVGESSFLSQFNGKSGSIDAKSIDTISGATISSKAVLDGINKVMENIKVVDK